jgi:hypothetical protein
MGACGEMALTAGCGINAGHHGEEAWIAGADKAGAAVVAWNILKEPGDGVVGVGGLVDRLGVRVVDVGAAHDEFAIAFVAAADVAADVDVAFTGQLWTDKGERGAVGSIATVGGALDEEWERGGDVGGLENDDVELDAVAHGDHGFGALVVVEEWWTGSPVRR